MKQLPLSALHWAKYISPSPEGPYYYSVCLFSVAICFSPSKNGRTASDESGSQRGMITSRPRIFLPVCSPSPGSFTFVYSFLAPFFLKITNFLIWAIENKVVIVLFASYNNNMTCFQIWKTRKRLENNKSDEAVDFEPCARPRKISAAWRTGKARHWTKGARAAETVRVQARGSSLGNSLPFIHFSPFLPIFDICLHK